MLIRLFIFSVGLGIGIACSWSAAFAQERGAPAKVLRYVAVIIQRYDQNGDEIMQREEWEKMPGTPQAIDLDGDGQITKDELVWYLTYYGKTRTIHRTMMVDLSEPYKFDPANLRLLHPVVPRASAPLVTDSETPQESVAEGVEAVMKANEQLIDDDLYQKMLEERQVPSVRPYYVLPDRLHGVPKWFILLDKNGDGQISLMEFAPTHAPKDMVHFKQLDKNDNGFIEPDEARTP